VVYNILYYIIRYYSKLQILVHFLLRKMGLSNYNRICMVSSWITSDIPNGLELHYEPIFFLCATIRSQLKLSRRVASPSTFSLALHFVTWAKLQRMKYGSCYCCCCCYYGIDCNLHLAIERDRCSGGGGSERDGAFSRGQRACVLAQSCMLLILIYCESAFMAFLSP